MYPPSPYVEPPWNSVIAWQTSLSGQLYTYVALRVRGQGWFLTGQLTAPLMWDALCWHLPPADGRFLVLGVQAQLLPST